MNKKMQWIRVRGVAVPDETEETYAKAFEHSPMLKGLYNEQTGNRLGLFWLKDGYAEIADMQGNFEKFEFGGKRAGPRRRFGGGRQPRYRPHA